MAEYMDRLPSTQRLITLDGVIYVHELPQRRRRRKAAGQELAAEPESLASMEEEPDLASVAAELPEVAELELAEVAAAPAEVVAEAPEAAADVAEVASEDEAEPPTVAAPADGPFYPSTPPGYAVEFGTGNLVPIYARPGAGRFRRVGS